MIEFAGLCIGVGILIEVYNRTDPKRKAENLASITQIDELKGLVDLLEKEPLSNPVVAIFGTVGSNSAVETTRSGTLCVFSEETATVCYKRDKNKNCNTYSNREESKEVMLYRKVVPWYLDDGTGRVYVTGAQFAKGFYATLNGYIFPEPVMEHFERFFSSKDVQFVPNRCREHVLEIGKPLTIIG
ncbi:E3 ubiquitin-protein ligase SP1 isoform X2 [Raphanus sativus]|nr:E3 ubiquitin-protein ligase SP1 isoform X2 [Raphanus sativus]